MFVDTDRMHFFLTCQLLKIDYHFFSNKRQDLNSVIYFVLFCFLNQSRIDENLGDLEEEIYLIKEYL